MLADISGGNKRNAIPREAKAVLFLKDVNKASEVMKRMEQQLNDEFEGIEGSIEIKHENIEGKEAFTEENSMKLISLLQGLPHGYLSFNPNIPGLVDTSTNLATLTLEDNEAVIGTSSRSSMNSTMESVRDVLIATGDLAGAIGKKGHSYPSWKPNMNSELLGIAKRVYKEKFGKEPEVKAIHAGLETAIIGQRFPGMDMTSIGPQIEFPHSPDERVEISSVKTFWDYLIALLENL
jgi:dipeptidase D